MIGRVASLSQSPSYTFSKDTRERVRGLEGLGLEGDVHSGREIGAQEAGAIEGGDRQEIEEGQEEEEGIEPPSTDEKLSVFRLVEESRHAEFRRLGEERKARYPSVVEKGTEGVCLDSIYQRLPLSEVCNNNCSAKFIR